MSPDVMTGSGQSYYVERAIVGPKNDHLYVGGEARAVEAIIDADRVASVALTEGEAPNALTQGMEPVEKVEFPADKPPVTVYTLEEVMA